MMWTILNSTGEVIYPCLLSAVHPSDPGSGFPWEQGMVAFELAFEPDPARHTWTGASWVVSLDLAKARKRVAINQLKDLHQNAPAPTSFGLIDNDDSSKIKLNGLTTMAMLAVQAQQPFAIDWTMADNSSVTLDAAQAMQMGQEAGMFVAQVHERARQLKDAVEAVTVVNGDVASAVAELEAIDIDSGWPTTP